MTDEKIEIKATTKKKSDVSPDRRRPTINSSSSDTIIQQASIKKTTDITPGSSSSSSSGIRGRTTLASASASTVRNMMKVYSPNYLDSALNFPRDLRTQNMWNRNFYSTNPIVRAAVNTHVAHCTGKFQLECEDPKILEFYQDMMEKMQFNRMLHDIALEYFKLGEIFPYLELDETHGTWDFFIIHNPDYIKVTYSPLSRDPIISLVPDESLKRIITSNNPKDKILRRQLPEELITHLLKGEDIPLENFNVSHIKLSSSPYDPRGTSLITSCYRDLMLLDKIREAKIVQADNMINPITLVKLGDAAGGLRPTDDDVRIWQEQVLDSSGDLNYTIVTHGMVTIEKITNSGQIVEMNADIEQCIKNISVGMMYPLETEYGSYASASVALETLKMRYEEFRNQLKYWIEKKVFEPIAKIQDHYVMKGGERKLIYPRVKWGRINLKETDSYINTAAQQVGEIGKPGKISVKSFLEILDCDYLTEMKRIKQEMIDATIQQKELQALQQMDLAELRTMTTETTICDSADLELLQKKIDISSQAQEMQSPELGLGEEQQSPDMAGLDLGGIASPPPAGEPPPSTPPPPAPEG